MSNATHIIDGIFGGIRPCARVLKKSHTTVQRWKSSGRIPVWHHSDVLEKGQEAGLPISEEDFHSSGGEHAA